MRSRLARLVVLVSSLGGLLGLTAPPAQANYITSTAFVATATLSSGLDYPLLTLVPGVTGNPLLFCLPLNGVVTANIPNCHIGWHHNQQAVSLASTACVHLTAAAPGKSLATGVSAACGFSGSGTVSGWCGLAGGQITKNFFNGHSFETFDIHFDVIDGWFIGEGHWFKPIDGQHGLILVFGKIIPPLPGSNESCLNKTARTFTLIGTAQAVSEPVL
jgi:hypothetical protein